MKTCFRSSFMLFVCILITSGFFSSCSSTLSLHSVENQHRVGDFESALQELEIISEQYLAQRGALLFALDKGVLAHYAGRWALSNTYLDEAERRIWESYTESISRNIASYVINDNTRPYQGEDYEDLYANVFKSLNYLYLGNVEGALVELRRFAEKQQMLKNKYDLLFSSTKKVTNDEFSHYIEGPTSIRFSTSALGNYLQMIISRDLRDHELTRFSAQQVTEAFAKQPTLYRFPLPSSFVDDSTRIEGDKHRVNIVAFTGLAPIKQEQVQYVYFSHNNYAKIALPYMVPRSSLVDSIEVVLSGGRRFSLERVEDIEAIAIEAFQLNRSYIETKTIIRSLLKSVGTSAIDVATEAFSSQATSQQQAQSIEIIGSLIGLFSRIFHEASESADVRISQFFPSSAWIGGIFLPQGVYDAQVIYKNRNGRILYTDHIQQLQVNNRNVHLWRSVCPL